MARCNNCFREYEEVLGLCPFCGFVPGETSSDVYCLSPGTLLGDDDHPDRYIIGQKIGMGGFGIIYKAWNRRLETMMAIKEFYPSGLVNRVSNSSSVLLASQKREAEFTYGKSRFLEEARYLAKFNSHPNIVNVFEYFEANGTAYFVMEYLDGKNFDKAIIEDNWRGQPISCELCVTIAVAICSALQSMHAAGILHRDISPNNIMLCDNGDIKLLDFGAARFPSGVEAQLRVVKPGFTPPEQYNEVDKQGPFTDIYALGATLYYALSGTVPEESTDRKKADSLIPLEELNPYVPHHISVTIMRAMAIEPQYRFPAIDTFESGLLQETNIRTEEEERKKRRATRRLGIIVSLAVVLGIGAFSSLAYMNASKASLPPADLTLWYNHNSTVSEDEIGSALSEIVDTFSEGYPDIRIQFEAKSLNELERFSEGINIVDTTYMEIQDDTEDYVTVSDLVGELNDEYYVQDSLLTDFQYPTGIIVPVIYVNSSFGEISSAASLTQMQEACVSAGGKMEVSAEGAAMYQALYGADAASFLSENAKENFISQDTFLYLGTSCDYYDIQESMPGEYTVLFPECGTSIYEYGMKWSVTEGDDTDERAARGFLSYLTSDLAQDYLYIQNQNQYLPISKSEMEVYVSVYGELEGVTDYLELPFVAEIDEEPGQPDSID